MDDKTKENLINTINYLSEDNRELRCINKKYKEEALYYKELYQNTIKDYNEAQELWDKSKLMMSKELTKYRFMLSMNT